MTTHIALTGDAIDRFMAEATARLNESHKSWSEFVTHVKFVIENPIVADPASEEFLQYQLGLWRTISGRARYDAVECEANDYINPETSIQQTYPFTSRNPQEIGSYFLGIANIVRNFPIPFGSRVVEFGIGYGHLTRMLSSMGYQVEAVDIEARFLDLLPKLSPPGAAPIVCRNLAFVDADYDAQSVDAFLFYECFHHCLDHVRLVQKMRQALRPGGAIIFAAEAFYDDWFDFPWGLRTDGHSVWAIRNYGWMELGFRKSFISDTLTRQGFSLEWSSLPDVGPYGELLIARLA